MNSELSLQTPALLFPALSLLILAYTNKFLAIAKLIRNLYSTHQQTPQVHILDQINSLRTRLNLIRWMQAAGLASNFFCVLTMLFVYIGYNTTAHILFFMALGLLMTSLTISVVETFLSAGAVNLLLKDLAAQEETSMTRKTVRKIGTMSHKIYARIKKDIDPQ